MTGKNERGPNDLEEQIDQLQKQKELLQSKELNRVSEENDNLKTLLEGKNE